MKIRLENILDKLLERIGLKRVEKRGEVVSFKTGETINKGRKGAQEIEKVKSKNYENIKVRQGIKIVTSMILLFLCTVTIERNTGEVSFNSNNDSNVSSIAVVSDSLDTPEEVTSNLTNKENMNNKNEEKEIVLATKAQETLIFMKPVEGEIQKIYSKDKVIYSKTLRQWKTHDGLDIGNLKSDEVKAIERGIVQKIYEDSFLGTTIVIEHISGYVSQYSNLEKETYVKEGQSVVKGQKIGKVGNTAIGESLDDKHLHFMVYFRDSSIDPSYVYN